MPLTSVLVAGAFSEAQQCHLVANMYTSLYSLLVNRLHLIFICVFVCSLLWRRNFGGMLSEESKTLVDTTRNNNFKLAFKLLSMISLLGIGFGSHLGINVLIIFQKAFIYFFALFAVDIVYCHTRHQNYE